MQVDIDNAMITNKVTLNKTVDRISALHSVPVPGHWELVLDFFSEEPVVKKKKNSESESRHVGTECSMASK